MPIRLVRLVGLLSDRGILGVGIVCVKPAPLQGHRCGHARKVRAAAVPARLLGPGGILWILVSLPSTICDSKRGRPFQATGRSPWFRRGRTSRAGRSGRACG